VLALVTAFALLSMSLAHGQEGKGDRSLILFDHTKGETVGNADWVVDDDEPIPLPGEPRSELDWVGALSAWGHALYSTGRFNVRTLPRNGGRISFGDTTNPHDLSRFEVFVVAEPNITFTQVEVEALEQFVADGGGLFLLANHCMSDRNRDGYDPPHILNQLTHFTGIYFHEESDGRPKCWLSQETRNVSSGLDDPILGGEYGRVEKLHLLGATSMLLKRESNPTVRGHIWLKDALQGEGAVVFATLRFGKGRVAALADSSPADDGTGYPGKRLFPNWDEPSHRALFLNATTWLAGE